MSPQQHQAIRLAILFLEQFSDRLGSDGCNDWTWPDWATEEFRKSITAVDGYYDEFKSTDCPNFIAVGGLLDKLKRML